MIQVTDEQMTKIRKHIIDSLNATSFAKQAMLWLLERSENLTKPVALSFPAALNEFGKDVSRGVHNMNSTSGKTFMSAFLKKLGVSMIFSTHRGSYVNGTFCSRYGGCTIWISNECYDECATCYQPDIQAIRDIPLTLRVLNCN